MSPSNTSNILEVAESFKVDKVSISTGGLNDNIFFDGVWIHEYVDPSTIEGKAWYAKSFAEKKYVFLAHGKGAKVTYSKDKIEIQFDSSVEKIELNGKDSLEFSVDAGTKFGKKLASLGASGTLEKTPAESLADKILHTVAFNSYVAGEDNKASLNIDYDVLEGATLTFEHDGTDLTLAAATTTTLADNEYLFDVNTKEVLFKTSTAITKDIQIKGGTTLKGYKYKVTYGGSTADKKAFNVVLPANIGTKVVYLEIYKAYLDPSKEVSFRSQNATDGGSTVALKFTASSDSKRSVGDQLFSIIDDFDKSI